MNARKLLSAAKAVEPAYIEDVFSTYLYTGNGSTQTITNGIDLAGKGGLVWIKWRSGYYTTRDHHLWDSGRGLGSYLRTNLDAAQNTSYPTAIGFNPDGYTLSGAQPVNTALGGPELYASWTFRKQAKFFDVVTYTGNGGTKTVNHNLGSTPGCIITKRTDSTSDWIVWHRTQTDQGVLNSTSTFNRSSRIGTVTSTSFNAIDAVDTNVNGATYVAYLFAHDAGGFGQSGSDNVITCGSYTGNGSATGPTVTLGYEPQWLLIKRTDAADSWYLFDVMRGLALTGNNPALFAELSSAEVGVDRMQPLSTGFTTRSSAASVNASGGTYIYIAIRRGPMRTPTTGTSVFSPNAVSTDATAATTNFPVDLLIEANRAGFVNNSLAFSRLTGGGQALVTSSDAAEFAAGGGTKFESNTSITPNVLGTASIILWNFRRAPGFFDVVCYTGTGANSTVSHNLGVVPELIIVKRRSGANQSWSVYSSATGVGNQLRLNLNFASAASANGFNGAPTAANFSVGISFDVNGSGATYVAYLFATCPGVSKVFSYTGNGSSQTINCGFTGGARFVLIKRTDSTGDWYVWDSARGIVAGNDPHLSLNSTAAEVTTDDSVDTDSTGFVVNQLAATNVNVNTATYIGLAIA